MTRREQIRALCGFILWITTRNYVALVMTDLFLVFSLQIFQKIRGRERGIRTPGGVTLNGFQDRRFQPLSHLPTKSDKKERHLKASEAKLK